MMMKGGGKKASQEGGTVVVLQCSLVTALATQASAQIVLQL